MPDPLEVELKLEVAPDDVAALGASPLLARHAATTARLHSVYFDTPDADLRRLGFSLRVRHDGARRVQTVKAEAAAAGLFVRSEWEQEVRGDRPQLDGSAGPLTSIVDAQVRERIAPVFRVAVERATRQVAVDDGALEVVVDRGEIAAGDRTAPVCEVEIELRHGSPAALFALARTLDEVVPLRLGVMTKSERGYRLLGSSAAGAAKAEPVPLRPGMTSAAAFRSIAASCLRQFRLNEALLAGGSRAGPLHQARVGLRRLRSALSLFRPMLRADPRFEPLRAELRWLAGVLGEARNLDVLIGHAPDQELADRLAASREERYREVAVATASRRARLLMLDFAEWLALGAWLDGAPGAIGERPVATTAADLLDRHRRRLKKRGAHLSRLGDHARHEVRIEAKKLRYAVEFFTALYATRKAKRRHRAFLGALEDLQSHLGDLNDQATAPLVLRRLGLDERAVAGWAAPPASRDALLAGAEAAYDALVDAKRFWRSG